jgi:hypothetical protein
MPSLLVEMFLKGKLQRAEDGNIKGLEYIGGIGWQKKQYTPYSRSIPT